MPAVPPTSGALRVTPVSVAPMAQMLRPVGTASSRSRDRTCCCVALFTSTIGDAPVTVTVSSSAPTLISALTVAVKFAGSSIPSRLITLKPASVNVTVYTPGRRSMMRNSPAPSVVTVLTRSFKAGLPASTVTPGNTAPVASLTTPAIALCANADPGENASHAKAARNDFLTSLPLMSPPNLGMKSKVQLDAELEDPRVEHRCRTPPGRTVLVVLREDGGFVQRVVDVERPLHPHAGASEVPDEANVELVEPVLEHRHRLNDVGDRHVGDVPRKRSAETDDLIIGNHVAREPGNPGQTLEDAADLEAVRQRMTPRELELRKPERRRDGAERCRVHRSRGESGG